MRKISDTRSEFSITGRKWPDSRDGLPPIWILTLRSSAMIRIAKKTRLEAREVIEKASRFFGKDGEGLEETERSDCCIAFAGIGGHVAVTIEEDDDKRSVDVEAREFEYQAKKFLEMV
jgi:hypothetical protein